MTNLLNVLSAEDKTKIDNYIDLYGALRQYRLSVDSWLQDWANNKTKLYKLLGNNLIYEIPFEYEENEGIINQRIRAFCNFNEGWFSNLYDWTREKVEPLIEEDKSTHDEGYVGIDKFIYVIQALLIYPKAYFIKDEFSYGSIKIKLKDNKKTLSLPKGIKPIRFISRFLNYCKDIEGAYELINEFNEIREAHSRIFNSKKMKGTLAFSIHPLDYMTMSDNSLNWSSCMSWRQRGCYRVGTIEMMNSNNVICCYIKGSEPFEIKEGDKTISWNNKKWRQLIYVTKDIIVSGKAYPYQKKDFTKAILTTLRKLAKENLNWDYSFGIEEYMDMKSVWSLRKMVAERSKMKHDSASKEHKILFDTKGMYNDMLNDKNTAYWCIRNKVPHTKIISYSGKAPCLCCRKPIIDLWEDEYWEDDHTPDSYNSRYSNTGSVICSDCLNNNFECDFCGGQEPRDQRVSITLSNGEKSEICKSCAKRYVKKCPDCGEPFFVTAYRAYKDSICLNNDIICSNEAEDRDYFIKINEDIDSKLSGVYSEKDSTTQSEAVRETFRMRAYLIIDNNRVPSVDKYLEDYNHCIPIYLCRKCKQNIKDRFTKSDAKWKTWYRICNKPVAISNNAENQDDWMEYFYPNLKNVDFKELEGKTITL